MLLLRAIQEKATIYMILIPILAGVYLIGLIGYAKLMSLVVSSSQYLTDALNDYPVTLRVIMGIMILAYPVSVYLTLAKKAASPWPNK